jgi:hypothetical protein
MGSVSSDFVKGAAITAGVVLVLIVLSLLMGGRR